jgi:peroxiredoxin
MKARMRRIALIACLPALAVALSMVRAGAELKPGAKAPPFSAQATLGREVFTFDLKEALERGPVVLYFYPAAFTTGCTIEAHDFATHMDDYAALGATVIGVSGDDIDKLKKFSVSECRSKFPVASDGDHAISKSYDALLSFGGATYSDRTSYVIDKSGTIVFSYHALDPGGHVQKTLEAVRKLRGPEARATATDPPLGGPGPTPEPVNTAY